jgi:hypothetical protein
MIEELKEQIHERVYNIKVPTLGFSRRDLFNIAMEYAEPREKRIAELEQQIEKMKICQNCDFFNYRFDACYYDKECKNKDHWKLRR